MDDPGGTTRQIRTLKHKETGENGMVVGSCNFEKYPQFLSPANHDKLVQFLLLGRDPFGGVGGLAWNPLTIGISRYPIKQHNS